MHGAQNTCLNAYHTPRKKCTCIRSCVPMQWCRNFSAMDLLRTHLESCASILQAVVSARPTAVSTKPDARRCSLKKSVQIHASSWHGRRCGVAQASFNHPPWCRPHPVCLWFALAVGRGPQPPQSSISTMFFAGSKYLGFVSLYTRHISLYISFWHGPLFGTLS